MEKSRVARFRAPPRVTALRGNGLAGVEPDAEPERKRGAFAVLLARAPLEVDCGAERVAGRREGNERLVTAELDQRAVEVAHPGAHELGKGCGERGGGLVSVFLGEARIAPEVCDQKGANAGLPSVSRVTILRVISG
jgi:hypothetical protein